MRIVFELEERVEDWLAAGGRVATPRPERCPACGHERLSFEGWYPRRLRRGRVVLHRVRCANERCGQRWHSLHPDVLVAGRCDLASVIGWGLEARAAGRGHRGIAVRLGVPAATVRGWLRAFARVAARVCAWLCALAVAAAPMARAPPAGPPVVMAVAAAHEAAAALASVSGEPVDCWRLGVRMCAGRLLG